MYINVIFAVKSFMTLMVKVLPPNIAFTGQTYIGHGKVRPGNYVCIIISSVQKSFTKILFNYNKALQIYFNFDNVCCCGCSNLLQTLLFLNCLKFRSLLSKIDLHEITIYYYFKYKFMWGKNINCYPCVFRKQLQSRMSGKGQIIV